MILDLHMHSKYSVNDGVDEIDYMLEKADKLGITHISITDHDSVKAYKEISEKEKNYKVKVIRGVELKTTLLGGSVDILAYNIDIDIIDEFLSKTETSNEMIDMLQMVMEFLSNKCDEKNIKYNKEVFDNPTVGMYESDIFWDEVSKYEENKKILTREFGTGKPKLFREHLSNPDSDWFFEPYTDRRKVEDIVKLVKDAGGLSFLAHPFEYGRKDNEALLNEAKRLGINGIECYHMSANEDEQNYLEKYALSNNMLISGGSDYHNHEARKHMITDLNFEVKKEYIKKWL
ncbi:MAG: PHP domain-containing protein [Clostridia bacterium]|jgi:predicted metal-dependent phosphoesterase TrpH|nr:PHP domain-containing protein [Clostridia bacterium]